MKLESMESLEEEPSLAMIVHFKIEMAWALCKASDYAFSFKPTCSYILSFHFYFFIFFVIDGHVISLIFDISIKWCLERDM
jgi:hypothetical protein